MQEPLRKPAFERFLAASVAVAVLIMPVGGNLARIFQSVFAAVARLLRATLFERPYIRTDFCVAVVAIADVWVLACEGRKKNGNYGLAVAGVLWSIVFEARFVSFGIGVEVDVLMLLVMMMMMMLALVLVLLLWFFRTPMQSRVQYRMSWCGWCSSQFYICRFRDAEGGGAWGEGTPK